MIAAGDWWLIHMMWVVMWFVHGATIADSALPASGFWVLWTEPLSYPQAVAPRLPALASSIDYPSGGQAAAVGNQSAANRLRQQVGL